MKKYKKIFQNKKVLYLTLCVLTVVVLIILSVAFGKKGDSGVQTEFLYGEYLENKLSPILSEIKDAGKVSVMITVSSENNYEIAVSTVIKSDGEKESSPYLVNGEPVKIYEKYPEITGVLIVAEGAYNYGVYNRLMEAATTLLGISEDKIQIMPSK